MTKTCSCGATYSKQEWEALPSKGVLVTEDDDNVYHLELKNCPKCSSTIGLDEQVTRKQKQESP